MKKIIAIVLVVMALLAFSACSKKGTCESCGKENVKLKKVTVEGESAKVCEDCADLVKGLEALAEGLDDVEF